MKQWLQRIMYGRYGGDELNVFLITLFIIATILNLFIHWPYMIFVYILLLVLCYARMLSRNIYRRRAENAKFMKLYAPLRNWWKDKKDRFRDRKTHKYFRCPQCGQRLRVPKGKGEITITCSKCRTRFDQRT
ncbi:MAG: hypothetical protein HFE68_04630 [Erysipelotrichaceae bacterium]|nr:hypothetical protein [Erysipelotrichaceae bacterium]MCI9312633.1 hypothetical protein [Erysipelotrichaceae bacterium]